VLYETRTALCINGSMGAAVAGQGASNRCIGCAWPETSSEIPPCSSWNCTDGESALVCNRVAAKCLRGAKAQAGSVETRQTRRPHVCPYYVSTCLYRANEHDAHLPGACLGEIAGAVCGDVGAAALLRRAGSRGRPLLFFVTTTCRAGNCRVAPTSAAVQAGISV
jgi:hypothetical protein